MHIGILQFEMHIDDAMSLKDKRRVVKSIKDRLHHEHMVSVAEIGALDVWNLAVLAVVAVNRDGGYLRTMLEGVLGKLAAWPAARLGEHSLEVVPDSAILADSVADDGTPLWTPDERREQPPENPS